LEGLNDADVAQMHADLDALWESMKEQISAMKHPGTALRELACSMLAIQLGNDEVGPHTMLRFNDWMRQKGLPYRMNAAGGGQQHRDGPPGDNPLTDSGRAERALGGIASVLVDEFDYLPDAIVILRIGGTCRTVFAANPETLAENAGDARGVLSKMFDDAVRQNRAIRRKEKRG
jgi:hypothetical protein